MGFHIVALDASVVRHARRAETRAPAFPRGPFMFIGRCGPLTIGLALLIPRDEPAPIDDLAV